MNPGEGMVFSVLLRMFVMTMVAAWFALVVPVLSATAAEGLQEDMIGVPDGLEVFLEARRLEAEGDYRSAAEKYTLATEQAPDVSEIRIAFASLLLDLGMTDNALEQLEAATEFDHFGRRIRALALAHAAGRRPERLPEARAALEEILVDHSEDLNLQFSLAGVLEAMDEIEEAEAMVARLREVLGNGPRLLGFHGRLLARLGRFAEAVEAFDGCVGDPFSADPCREGLAQSLVASGRRGEAGHRMLAWLEPDDLDGLMRAAALLSEGGRPDEALQVIRRVLATDSESPSARMLEALVLTDLGRFAEAEPKLKELARKNPTSVDILLALAWSSTAAGGRNTEEGRRLVGRAWEEVSGNAASPGAAHVCLSAARLELAGGHPNAAREWLSRIGDQELAGPQALHLLAETFRRGENWIEGAGALLRLQPGLGPQLRSTAIALEVELRSRGGDRRALRRLRPLQESDDIGEVFEALQVFQRLELWHEAEATSRDALVRFPDDRGLLFFHASSLERLGRHDESGAQFEALLERNPDDFDAANYLGYMWADQGENLDRALVLVEKAVAADPENSAFLDSLGWVQYRLGRFEQAERWLRRAIQLGGESDGTVLAHLGEVLLKMGHVDEAKDLLRQSLEAGCDSPEHVRGLLEGVETEVSEPAGQQ